MYFSNRFNKKNKAHTVEFNTGVRSTQISAHNNPGKIN